MWRARFFRRVWCLYLSFLCSSGNDVYVKFTAIAVHQVSMLSPTKKHAYLVAMTERWLNNLQAAFDTCLVSEMKEKLCVASRIRFYSSCELLFSCNPRDAIGTVKRSILCRIMHPTLPTALLCIFRTGSCGKSVFISVDREYHIFP